MKQCPSCNQTYADTQLFCAADGSKLIDQAASQPVTSPPQPVRISQPRRSSWLAVLSLVVGLAAGALLFYVFAQEIISAHEFRGPYVSMWTLGFSGIALTLGVMLTILSVLTGIPALVLSFLKRDRFGGRVAALVGPIICVIACVLALGLFIVRRHETPVRYGLAERYSPTSIYNTSPSASMTVEEKYRLFYAATKTEDKFLQAEAARQIGLIDGSGKPTDSYGTFVSNAMAWASNDVAFIRSVDSPAKARVYVNAHMNY